jgi:hypothetical protein
MSFIGKWQANFFIELVSTRMLLKWLDSLY